MDWNFGHGIMRLVTFNRFADWKLQSSKLLALNRIRLLPTNMEKSTAKHVHEFMNFAYVYCISLNFLWMVGKLCSKGLANQFQTPHHYRCLSNKRYGHDQARKRCLVICILRETPMVPVWMCGVMCPAMTWTKQQKRFAKKKVSTGSWTISPLKRTWKKNKPLPNLLFLRGSMLSKNAMSVHRLTIDTWQVFQWNFLASPRLPTPKKYLSKYFDLLETDWTSKKRFRKWAVGRKSLVAFRLVGIPENDLLL